MAKVSYVPCRSGRAGWVAGLVLLCALSLGCAPRGPIGGTAPRADAWLYPDQTVAAAADGTRPRANVVSPNGLRPRQSLSRYGGSSELAGTQSPQPIRPDACRPAVMQPNWPARSVPSAASRLREPLLVRIGRWLRSGHGIAWGAAKRGPRRDLELDRIMLDTLTSSEPDHSRDPLEQRPAVAKEAWLYPQ